jgi:hypothetical protein
MHQILDLRVLWPPSLALARPLLASCFGGELLCQEQGHIQAAASHMLLHLRRTEFVYDTHSPICKPQLQCLGAVWRRVSRIEVSQVIAGM